MVQFSQDDIRLQNVCMFTQAADPIISVCLHSVCLIISEQYCMFVQVLFPTTVDCEIISSDSRMGLQGIATDSRTFYMHIQQCN